MMHIPDDADNPRVRSLSIVDGDGRVTAHIGPNEAGEISLLLYDGSGVIRVSASVCGNERGQFPTVALHDDAGAIQVANVLAPGKAQPEVPLLADRFCKLEP